MNGHTMNKVYEMLKPLTSEQIKECRERAFQTLPSAEARLFANQCGYALAKKAAGKW